MARGCSVVKGGWGLYRSLRSSRCFFHFLVSGGACWSTDGSAINSDACTCGEDVCAMNQFCDASAASGSECTSNAATSIKYRASTAFCARQLGYSEMKVAVRNV